MTEGATPSVRLADGRELAFQSFGDPAGRPAFYFHGFPGSRLEAAIAGEGAARGGVQLIAIDRPGFGGSDPQPGRRILDWPRDVAQLADALGLERFAVMGVSGGGPYAAATAYALPERVTSAVLVAGVGPMDGPGRTRGQMPANRMLFGAARNLPFVLRLAMRLSARMLRKSPEKLLARMQRTLPEPDRRVASDPKVTDLFLAAAQEAFRQGPAAAVQEGRLFVQPWGFAMQDVRVPVHVFQGELDRNVPAWMGHEQAERYPDCTAHFYPDEGHLSLPVNRQDDIVAALTSA